MTKLSYVSTGDQVDFTFLVAVMVEAKFRNCPLFDLISYKPYLVENAESFNKIIDWLVLTYPDEFELA